MINTKKINPENSKLADLVLSLRVPFVTFLIDCLHLKHGSCIVEPLPLEKKLGWRDERDRREDDVRPTAKTNGS